MKKQGILFGRLSILAAIIFLSMGCLSKDDARETENTDPEESEEGALDLSTIKLPEGFEIAIYAEVSNARSMVLSESGTLFVGNRAEDKVYAVRDEDGDNVGEKVIIIDEDLNTPNGVAIKDGDLYVAEINRILRYRNIEDNLANPPEPEVVYDQFPTERHHGWKYIAFGPDGKLYVPVGAPCNICLNEDKPIFASITRIDVENPEPEIVAHGVRNTVGFDWNPVDGKLWFTDNGRDMMGDDIPPCELNVVEEAGQHFGYPFCHGGTIQDTEFGDRRDCSEFVKPVANFVAHTAPLGMNFYKGSMFPAEYENKIFVAQHGSWNRSEKSGYRVMMIDHDNTTSTKVSVFAEGWLNHESQVAWGRPVDVISMADGAILISDDYADVIYRVSYKD